MLTLPSQDKQRWATASNNITMVIRRLKKTCQKKPLWGKNMTGNLSRNHGPNSKQLAAHPTKLHSYTK